jgi:hypothetical protein
METNTHVYTRNFRLTTENTAINNYNNVRENIFSRPIRINSNHHIKQLIHSLTETKKSQEEHYSSNYDKSQSPAEHTNKSN